MKTKEAKMNLCQEPDMYGNTCCKPADTYIIDGEKVCLCEEHLIQYELEV